MMYVLPFIEYLNEIYERYLFRETSRSFIKGEIEGTYKTH